MPHKWSWIYTVVKEYSESGCVLYTHIRWATAIDNLLASEEVLWICFHGVRECARLLRVNIDGMTTLAKSTSFQKPHANLPDTPVALTSGSKYVQMLWGPPGEFQSALRLCKSILWCSWKDLQLWMCIQDAKRFDYPDCQMLEQVRPPPSSAGELVPYSQCSSS
jgi:hypothetical protein